MTILRRFLVLQLLMLWQGGFLFYAAVVVPTGTKVLGGSFEQGHITRFVTEQMNVIGAVALAFFVWELLHARPRLLRQRCILWGCWLIMAAGLTVLFLLHPRMVEMVNFESSSASRFRGQHADFRFLHRTYLWIVSIQWAVGLVFALVMIAAWRRADRQMPNVSTAECGMKNENRQIP
jgi:hypothetical protein